MTVFQDLDVLTEYLAKQKRSARAGGLRASTFAIRTVLDRAHDEACTAQEALESVRTALGSDVSERLKRVEEDLQAFKASHKMQSGEPAEMLTSEAQDARSWVLIEQWWGEGSPLAVEFIGPYFGTSGRRFFVRLPNGQTSGGATRSDALAHAAEWCKGQL